MLPQDRPIRPYLRRYSHVDANKVRTQMAHYEALGKPENALKVYRPVFEQHKNFHLEAIKLVAKAHLLAGLGPKARPGMGAYLQDLYAKGAQADKELVLFRRDYLPPTPAIDKKTAVSRAETLYRNVMPLHIDNGRKTYAAAAYYCALLGDSGVYDGREAEFKQSVLPGVTGLLPPASSVAPGVSRQG